jgi:hypothetical protein
LFFGFLAEDGTGGYTWVPDTPNWATVKGEYSATTPDGKNYDNRLFNFAEFWLTRRKKEGVLAPYLLFNTEYPEILINRYDQISDFNQPVDWVIGMIQDAFESKFLPLVKSLTM